MAWDRKSRHERGYGAQWERIRERILERDLYLCQPCLRASRVTSATDVHHVKLKADGGTDDPSNLVSTCSECHRKAHGEKPKRTIGADGWPV